MKHTIRMTLAALLPVALLVSWGCKADRDDTRTETVGKTTDMPGEMPGETHGMLGDHPSDEMFDQERSRFVTATQQELHALDDKVDDLEGQIDALAGDAQASAREALERVKEQASQVKASLERARAAGATEWNEVKAATQKAMTDFKSEYSDLTNKVSMGTQPSPDQDVPQGEP